MSTVRQLTVALALLLLSSSAGCFEDPAATDTDNGDETGDEVCPDGSAGCDCYGNDTCDQDLECIDGLCKLPECVAGSLNCDCYEGVCLTGLLCMEGVCKPDDPMMGCQSVADCDANLCTQGDALCGGTCQPGVGVQCPIGAACDGSSGSCSCDPGSKVCGNACIPDSQCCGDVDCGAGSSCQSGFCTCDGGLVCDGQCIAGASCCPGETTIMDCTCGGQKTCSAEGTWSECEGGNPDPKCDPGQLMQCGKCGAMSCTADCNWTECQSEGECTPGTFGCDQQSCSNLSCTQSCFWEADGTKCC